MTMRGTIALSTALLVASSASAACVNRFTSRSEGTRQIITFLTGKLTFQEARTLADDIRLRRAAPLTWVGDDGKAVAQQIGELKIVRPMPVACDNKPSGVVMIATFLTPNRPVKKMNVRLDQKTVVAFDEQP